MRRFSALVAAVVLALVATGCGSDDDTTASGATSVSAAETATTPTSAPTSTAAASTTEAPTTTTVGVRAGRPYAVDTTTMTFVDDARPTPASDTAEEQPDRTLEVWLYLPDTDAPAPLVVFSHGMAGHPRKFEDLHTAWAEAGYAVAAPAFPLSNDTVEGSFGNLFDVPNQPGDVVFVLDQLLAMNDDLGSELAGRFDPERLATGGLSAGGATTYQAAVDDGSRDDRFRAAIVMAGARLIDDDGGFVAPADQPVFILHGDADPLIPLDAAAETYAMLGPPRYLLTLLGGGHAGPFEDADDTFEEKAPGNDDLVQAATVAFLDRHLLDETEAATELEAIATSAPELAMFEQDPG